VKVSALYRAAVTFSLNIPFISIHGSPIRFVDANPATILLFRMGEKRILNPQQPFQFDIGHRRSANHSGASSSQRADRFSV
jgi:hypothetical protein